MSKAGIVLAVAAVVMFGCGKGNDEKLKERELNMANVKVHEVEMEKMVQLGRLGDRIDSMIVAGDARFRGAAGHASDDLRAARQKIDDATSAMKTWMGNYTPYDESLPHEQSMAALRKTAQELSDINAAMDSAISAAEIALTTHQHTADSLRASTGKGKR